MEKLDMMIDLKNYIQMAEQLDDNEKNRRLLHYFPWMEPLDWYGHKVKVIDMIESGEIWTAWNDFPLGWRKAFGWEMLKELDQVIREDKLESFGIEQIKEKFGGLRFYCAGGNRKIHDIISKYEELSYKTCIECGKPAEWISKGWISPWCGECKEKLEKEGCEFYSLEACLEKAEEIKSGSDF